MLACSDCTLTFSANKHNFSLSKTVHTQFQEIKLKQPELTLSKILITIHMSLHQKPDFMDIQEKTKSLDTKLKTSKKQEKQLWKA